MSKTRPAARVLTSLLALAVGCYLAASVFLYFRQEALLFFPDPEDPADAAPWTAYETQFKVNGQILDGWYIPGESNITLIYYGGNADELSRSLGSITSLGPFNYLLMNYRGYGQSTGTPGENALKNDAHTILEMASLRFGFNIRDTVLIGRSLGSGVATHVAASYPVSALILVTPYDSVRAVAQGRYPVFPVGLLLKHPFDSVAYVNEITIPTLILKAESDRIVPHAYTDNLIANWQGPLIVSTLPGTHNSVVNSPEYRQSVRGFIEQQFAAP